jgi:drug/metabolite transporter (DMT)-like permease
VTGRRGAAAGLAAALLFGLSTPVAKLLLPGAGPFLLAGLLYLGSGIALSALAPLRGAGREAPLRRGDLGLLAGLTLAGGVAGPVLLMIGLARVPASSAALLLNLEAPFTIAVAVTLFGESLTRREAAGAAVIVLGGAVLSAAPGELSGGPAGALAVAAACLCWAVDNNLAARLSLRDPVAVVRAKSLAAGAVNVAIGLAAGERIPPLAPLAGALLTGALGYGLSIVLHLRATRTLGAARQGALFAAAPFAGALASIALLAERPGWREAAAAAAMAGGILAMVRARHGHLHAHAPVSHDHAHVHDEHHRHPHPPGTAEPHAHPHLHAPLVHEHPHVSDAHHRHGHRDRGS